MKYFFKMLIVILIFSSCKNQLNDKNIILQKDYQDKIVKLKSAKVTFKNIVNHSSCNFQIIDSVLIICNSFEEPFFQCYNKINFKYINSFGKQGKGPAEFNHPSLIKQLLINKKNNHILLLILDDNKIDYVDFQNAINNKKDSIIIKEIYLPAELYPVNNCVIVKDNFIFGVTQSFPKGNNFLYDFKKDKITWLSFYPKLKEFIQKDKIGFIYNNFVGVSPKNDHNYCMGYELFKRINLYKNTKEPISVVFDSKNDYPKIDSKTGYEDNKSKKYFVDLYTTKDYIYALNFNMSNLEITQGNKINSQIFKTDWTGKLISVYELDPFITSFIIDEKGEKIIASSQFFEDNFFIYNINNL